MTLSVAVDLSDGREGLVRTLRSITDTSFRFDFSPDEFDFGGPQHTTTAPGRPNAWNVAAAGARADEAPEQNSHRGESQ